MLGDLAPWRGSRSFRRGLSEWREKTLTSCDAEEILSRTIEGAREMHEQDLALVKALVPVAWADGEFKEPEREMLSAILSAYRATPDDEKVIFEYAKEKRGLDDIELGELSAGDRRVLLQQAVLLTFADGNQAYAEREFLGELAKRLRIPDDEAKDVMGQAAERAKSLLNLL